MTIDTLMALTVTFDVNQIRPRVNWQFSQVKKPAGNTDEPQGSWRNNIQFIPGQQFRIELVMQNFYDKPLTSVRVIDCCLITRPQIRSCGPGQTPQFAPPSPFVSASLAPMGALVSIPPDEFQPAAKPLVPVPPEAPIPPGGKSGVNHVLIWDGHLVVGSVQSHWDLTFYVTVGIERAPGQIDYRVFYFDPESEVGNGMDPP